MEEPEEYRDPKGCRTTFIILVIGTIVFWFIAIKTAIWLFEQLAK